MAAIFGGAYAVVAFEGGTESKGAAVAHLLGDVCGCPAGGGKQLAGQEHPPAGEVGHRRFAH